MITTLIITSVLIGFIIILFIVKSFWPKQKKESPIKKQDKYDYESNFIKLYTIIEANYELQEIETINISKLNNYLQNKLIELKNSPQYIFNLYYLEVVNYLDDFIETKLTKNSPSVWKKKFNDEFVLLKYKINDLITNNNELQILKNSMKSEIMKGWKNEKMKNSLYPTNTLG